jgi:hypothetical protein
VRYGIHFLCLYDARVADQNSPPRVLLKCSFICSPPKMILANEADQLIDDLLAEFHANEPKILAIFSGSARTT